MYGLFIYMYHKNQPNRGKYMVQKTLHGSYGLWEKGFSSRRVPTFCQKTALQKHPSKLRHRTRQHFCFAQMCPIPSCTTSPGDFLVRSRLWWIWYNISFIGHSHICHKYTEKIGGLYPIPYPYGTTGIWYHIQRHIMPGHIPGLQVVTQDMMGIQDSINVNHQCSLNKS